MNAALIALASALSQDTGLSEQSRAAALEVLVAAQAAASDDSDYADLLRATRVR